MNGFDTGTRIKLGYAPTRRNIFSREDALSYKERIRAWLDARDIELCDLEDLNGEGLLYDRETAVQAAAKFTAAGVDAVFAPHCNFGTEEAVALLGSLVKKPLLLWGPRDETPLENGLRLRDSQCGLFATSKVLQRYGVPFTYIENCRLEDPAFAEGFHTFLAAANVVKRFTGMRVGQVSTRPDSFLSVICNESELLERFGIRVAPITLVELLRDMRERLTARGGEYAARAKDYEEKYAFGCKPGNMEKMLALKDTLLAWAKAENLSAIALQCWNALMDESGVSPCFINAELTGEGLPVVCETDVCGAVTAVMTQAAALDKSPIFFADLTVRHPTNDNAELLWHCGSFPHVLRKPGAPGGLSDHYTLPTGCPGVCEWEIQGGEVTVCRFDGLGGKYSLLAAKGRGVEGPYCKGTYLWTEFRDWPALERRFIEGPYIHHVAGVHGDVMPALREALRYLPGVDDDLF